MDWPFFCSVLTLIVWKGHVKGDWEKVRCLHCSGVHIFHQTVVHSLWLLSCYHTAENNIPVCREILFQIVAENKLLFLTVLKHRDLEKPLKYSTEIMIKMCILSMKETNNDTSGKCCSCLLSVSPSSETQEEVVFLSSLVKVRLHQMKYWAKN